MKKKIVLIDMDGVLCQYDEKMLQIAHTRYGLPLYTSEDIDSFHTEGIFPEEYHKRVDAIGDEEGFFESLEPFPGAIKAFHEIAALPDVRVFICTSPKSYYKNQFSAIEKLAWVSKFLGPKWTDKVIITRDKTLVSGDILIDDKPTVNGAMKPVWTHVHYDRPYNRETKNLRIVSWNRWEEVLLPLLRSQQL